MLFFFLLSAGGGMNSLLLLYDWGGCHNLDVLCRIMWDHADIWLIKLHES